MSDGGPVRIAGWTADAVLGTGGAATVFRAIGPSGQFGALKLLRQRGSESRQRLAREAGIGRRVAHPHVVEVLDHVEADREAALVLEYVRGPSLAEVLEVRPRLPMTVVQRLGSEVLAGVEAAHRLGIAHRDLKPANVLLAPIDGAYTAKVADFGLAKPETPLDSLRTASDAVVGTLVYMAPEQLRGARADARSDVFSLGCVLYELLCGERAFPGGDDRVELIGRIADVAVRPLLELRPDVPPSLAAAVSAALAPRPEDRPADASELLASWGSHPKASWPEPLLAMVHALHDPEPLTGIPNNLPPHADGFVGRTSLLESTADALADERVVVLRGTGGVGKTRLALEVAHQLRHEFPGGVWFCDCAASRSAEGVATAVANALGLPLRGDALAEVGKFIAARGPALWIVDNFEQVAEFAPQTVGSWAEGAPKAAFLVTSRVRLMLSGVHVPVDVLEPREALTLFEAHAKAASPSFELTEQTVSVARDIVEGLDGLPLAIEIAAARVRGRDLDKLHAALPQRIHRLASRSATSSAHQRTLEATLAWSWDLLTREARAALGQLSAFEGGASPAAASAVLQVGAGSVDEALAELHGASLVRRTDAGRWVLLRSVQVFAGSRLSERAQGLVEAEHGAHFARMGWEAGLGLTGEAQLRWRAALIPELDNLFAAVRRATVAERPSLALACLRGAWEVFAMRGPWRAGLDLAQAVVSMRGATDAERHVAHLVAGEAALRLGETDVARQHCQSAEQATDASVSLRAACRLAELRPPDERQQAIDAYSAVLSVATEPRERMTALLGRGHCLHHAGRLDEALTDLRAILDSCEDVKTRGVAAQNVGTILHDRGEGAESRRYYELALETDMRVGNLHGTIITRVTLAGLLQQQGEVERAETMLEQAAADAVKLGLPRLEGYARGALCTLLFHREPGRWAEEERRRREILRLFIQAGATDSVSMAYLNLAVNLGQQGLLEQSEALIDKGVEVARESGRAWYLARALQAKAFHVMSDRPWVAAEVFAEAIDVAEEAGDIAFVSKLRVHWASTLAFVGQADKALVQLDLAEERLRTWDHQLMLAAMLCVRARALAVVGDASASDALERAIEACAGFGGQDAINLGQELGAAREAVAGMS